MTHTRNKQKSMKKHMRMLAIILIPVVALILGVATPELWANDDDDDDDDDESTFEEAELFFELNDTDGDLGIHALIDGDPWKRLKIKNKKNKKLLDVKVLRGLKRQGLTEFFFESAEPPFDSEDPEEEPLPPEEFFERFPAGDYTIKGTSLEGEKLESVVELSHVMPAPPVVYINDTDTPAAEDCDAVLPEVMAGEPVTILWDAVTESHPTIGEPRVPIDVVNYEVVVEIDETPWVTSTILPPVEPLDETGVNSFVVPQEILDLGVEEDGEIKIKFEVLVREASYNQTAVESCFIIIE